MSSGAFERAVLLGLGGSGSHMWTSLTPFTTSPPSSPQSLTSQLAGWWDTDWLWFSQNSITLSFPIICLFDLTLNGAPFTTSLPPSLPQSLTSQLAGEISEIGYGRSLLESSLTYRKTWENHTSFVWSDTIHHIATVGASKHNITTCWMDTQNGFGWSFLESSLTVVFVYFVCLFVCLIWRHSPHHHRRCLKHHNLLVRYSKWLDCSFPICSLFVWSDIIHLIITVFDSKPRVTTCW